MKKRTIFIWDIHWCFDELELLIEKLSISKKDTIYFTGDYINKWPKSFKVLKFLYKNQNQYKWVLWNRDLDFLKKLSWKSKIKLTKLEKELSEKLEKNPKILKYYKSIPLYIKTPEFILVHAWVTPGKKLKEHTKKELTTLRKIDKEPWYKYYDWSKKIIYGHWAVNGIHIGKNVVWLDSWCCYWGFLTAYTLETGELIQQSALKKYSTIKYSKK